jgi:hypothetical protein
VSKRLSRPQDMTPEELSRALRNAKILETWINSIREYALSLAQAGTEIPGYKVTSGKKRREWDPRKKAELVKWAESMGLSREDVTTLITPAQLVKLLTSKGKLPAKLKSVDKEKAIGPFVLAQETFEFLRATKLEHGDPLPAENDFDAVP